MPRNGVAAVEPSPKPTSSQNSWFLPVRVGKYGAACRIYGTNTLGPPSYRVTDLGKQGVPAVSARRLAVIKRIEHYIESATLWFAYTSLKNEAIPDGFIVFEASGQNTQPPFVPPCTDTPLGYEVLNVAADQYYESSEEPWPHAYCCSPVPEKPWLNERP